MHGCCGIGAFGRRVADNVAFVKYDAAPLEAVQARSTETLLCFASLAAWHPVHCESLIRGDDNIMAGEVFSLHTVDSSSTVVGVNTERMGLMDVASNLVGPI